MSYDLTIWSSKKTLDCDALFAENGYEKSAECFVRAGETWQVVINDPDNEGFDPEDIPDEIKQSLPDVEYMIVINLEGDVPEEIWEETFQFCETLAKNIKGILEDPQAGTIISG